MSGRHQLVVLGIFSGQNFPTPVPGPAGAGKLVVRGQLGGVWLATEGVSACVSPKFVDQHLRWEVTSSQLRECRSRKVMLKVEVWRGKEMLGHLVMDLRTAVPLKTKQDLAPVKNYRLIGSGASLELSLALEEVDVITTDISEEEEMETGQESKGVSPTIRLPSLSPVLMESGDGSGGYFQIGPQAICQQKFSLSICLVCAENLYLVPAKGLVLQLHDPFYFQYDLLGVDISTEQFSSLDKPDFVSEKATAMICSNQDYIKEFLSSAGVSIKLCHGATVLAAAELELGHLIPDSGQLEDRMTYQGKVDMVAAHNLTVPEDGEGNRARIGLLVTMEREEMNLSTGRLSDSEMEAEIMASEDDESAKDKTLNASSTNPVHDDTDYELPPSKRPTLPMNYNNEQPQSAALPATTNNLSFRPPSPPTKLPHTVQTIMNPLPTTTPTKLPQSILTPTTPLHQPPIPTELPQTPLGDTTDYLSPPLPPTKSYKLSVELKTVCLADSVVSSTDAVLAYKYLALHKEVITTSTFSLEGDKVTAVPGGYCQFSFTVQDAKMRQTFDKHLLKIGLYVGGQKRGVASVNLAEVVGRGKWSGQVELMGAERVLGRLEVDLQLEGDQQLKQGSEVVKQSDVQTGDMLAMAARELEKWKMDQKKQFNESLVQVEVQHLTLLGKEWREREKEREKVVQEKMDTMKVLEQELRGELEKMEVERREMDEKKRSVENEWEKIEREKLDLKNEKIALVERLKQQLREKEAEVAIKTSEIEMLTNKLEVTRGDVEKRNAEKSAGSRKDSEIVAELAQLRAEKTTWSASIEQASKEKQFFMNNCEQLRRDVVQLQMQKDKAYNEQIAGLDKQVRELKSQLVEQRVVTTEKSFDPAGSVYNAETQTPQVQPPSSMSTCHNDRTDESIGLARLEENRAMLLRTGVYRETDHVVLKVTEQIEKMRDKLRK
eukprot:GFUD01044507.1.p1 GENE.GFUD01044507.1~~GFUD01044507.1.p1  ORF type:complete len:946 (+),score=340.11 GFUD01044507.1:101-2938(+)